MPSAVEHSIYFAAGWAPKYDVLSLLRLPLVFAVPCALGLCHLVSSGSGKKGRTGKDAYIRVPCGTLVSEVVQVSESLVLHRRSGVRRVVLAVNRVFPLSSCDAAPLTPVHCTVKYTVYSKQRICLLGGRPLITA